MLRKWNFLFACFSLLFLQSCIGIHAGFGGVRHESFDPEKAVSQRYICGLGYNDKLDETYLTTKKAEVREVEHHEDRTIYHFGDQFYYNGFILNLLIPFPIFIAYPVNTHLCEATFRDGVLISLDIVHRPSHFKGFLCGYYVDEGWHEHFGCTTNYWRRDT